MAPSERKARLDRDAAFVEQNTTSTWLQIAVQDMRRVQNTSDGIEVPKTLALTSGRNPDFLEEMAQKDAEKRARMQALRAAVEQEQRFLDGGMARIKGSVEKLASKAVKKGKLSEDEAADYRD